MVVVWCMAGLVVFMVVCGKPGKETEKERRRKRNGEGTEKERSKNGEEPSSKVHVSDLRLFQV